MTLEKQLPLEDEPVIESYSIGTKTLNQSASVTLRGLADDIDSGKVTNFRAVCVGQSGTDVSISEIRQGNGIVEPNTLQVNFSVDNQEAADYLYNSITDDALPSYQALDLGGTFFSGPTHSERPVLTVSGKTTDVE